VVPPQYFIPVAPTPPREPFSIARSFTQNERQSHGDCNTPRVSQRDEQRRRQEKSMASIVPVPILDHSGQMWITGIVDSSLFAHCFFFL